MRSRRPSSLKVPSLYRVTASSVSYQLSGSSWGHELVCPSSPSQCGQVGPYFAGLSEAACHSQGGTYCYNSADCSDLRDCLADLKSQPQPEGFLAYLNKAPAIDDTSSHEQCGRVRNYFGFDEMFVHDIAVCEDVEQLKYTKDFTFMDEFFNQGDANTYKNGKSPTTRSPPQTVDPFDPDGAPILSEIDRGKSNYVCDGCRRYLRFRILT